MIKLVFAIGCLSAAAVVLYPRLEIALAEFSGGSDSGASVENPIAWMDRPPVQMLDDLPLVAFTGIRSRDNVYALQLEAAKWSEPLADLLAVDNQARWVERQVVQQAIDEINLTQYLSQEADVLQIGRWARADLVVHAWVGRSPDGPVWDIKVIDTLTAEAVASQTWRPDAPEGLLGIDRDLDSVMKSIQDTLTDGIAAARKNRRSTRLAGLFIQNLSPSARLSELEPAVLSALEAHTSVSPDLHLIRFDHTDEAGGEQALAMMGLTDNRDQAWMGVAHYYLWGSVRQVVVDDRVDTDGWELNLQVWDGGEQTHEVTIIGAQQTLVADVERAVAQVLDRLPERPSEKLNAAFPAILSERLIRQSDQLRSDLLTRSAEDAIPTTDWGWRIHAGRQKLNELACFFDPTNPHAWSALLQIKREAMLGDQDREYQRITEYMDARRNALRVAGASALSREDAATIDDLIRKLSGGWGMRGVPEGMVQDDFLPRVQPLIADILASTPKSPTRSAETLLSVLKATTTNAQRVEATQMLWPSIRPDWERRQRSTQGRDSQSSHTLAIDQLEARITKLFTKIGREALIDELFTLSALPEPETKPGSSRRALPPTREIVGYDLRWTPNPNAVLTNQGYIPGIASSDTETGPYLLSVEPYIKGLGLDVVSVDALSPSVGFFRPKDHDLSRQRVPVLAGGEGFTAFIDQADPSTAGHRRASGSITQGSPRVGDGRRSLAEVVLPGFESYPFPLGDVFAAATQATDLAVVGDSIWVSTTTEGVFELDLAEGHRRQYLFDQGLIDRNIPRLLANADHVVLSYGNQPTLAVKSREAVTFENIDFPSIGGTQVLWPEALSGRRALVSHAGQQMLWVVDLETKRLLSLEITLKDFVKQRQHNQKLYFPTVRAYASDADSFYLLFDEHLVQIDAEQLTAQSWRVPALDWIDLQVGDHTLWLTAEGPGLPDFEKTRSLLIWGWDVASQRGGRVVVATSIDGGAVSLSQDHLWVGRPRFATGYPFTALREAMGLAPAAPMPETQPSPAVFSRAPAWLTLDLSDPEAVRAAVAGGVIEEKDTQAITRVLQQAVAHDQPEILRPLIDRFGLEPLDALSSHRFIHQAAEAGAMQVVDLWIEYGDPNQRSVATSQAIHGLASSGLVEELKIFLPQALPLPKQGWINHHRRVTIRFKGLRETTALEAAAYRGHAEVVDLLLQIPHDQSDLFIHHALVLAVLGQHPDIVEALLNAGADPAGQKYHRGYSAAQLALGLGDEQSLSLFMNNDRDAVSASLSEPRFIRSLIHANQFESLQRLIRMGINLDQREEFRLMSSDRSVSMRAEQTALPISFSKDSPEFWQALIDAGLDYDHPQDGVRLGDAMLIDAAVSLPRLAVSLLDAGYGPDVPDAYGTTPLMAACLKNQPAMIELLLERGADPTRTNLDGQSAVTLLPEDAPEALRQTLAEFRPQDTAAVRTMADGAAGPSPMQAARQLRQHIRDGDVDAARTLIDFAMIDYDDGVGAAEDALRFAIEHRQPEIAVMIARQDWTLPQGAWTAYHRFNEAVDRNYVEVAQVILNRSGWSTAERTKNIVSAIEKASASGQSEIVAWLESQR